jgi:hypothetical protein
MSTRRIVVAPALEFWRRKRLFEALACLEPVVFIPADSLPETGVDGFLSFDQPLADAVAIAQSGFPVCHFSTPPAAAPTTETDGPEVLLSSTAALDPPLRGRKLHESDLNLFQPLMPGAGDEVVATRGGRAFWLRQPVGGVSFHRVGAAPLELGTDECLWTHFHAGRFARLLPLLHFIREVVGDAGWNPGPLRAAFVFDDPDLSRSSYGCLDFASLARHAVQHRYHATIAVVPLTAGRVDRNLARLFQSHPRHLSLLIHGNDHTACELLRLPSEARALASLAQALRRMERMEKRFGLEVSRVMEAPHAALARDVFPVLAALGYEAAMATIERMLQHNPLNFWPPEFGMDIAEIMAGGIGVIPRINMTPRWKTEVVLTAFLRKPVVLAGHHQDSQDGLQLLADFAELVNSFGPVEWGSLTTIARSGFKTRLAGGRLRIKAYQRRVTVPIPEGVGQIAVERPWLRGGGEDLLSVESTSGFPLFNARVGDNSPVLSVSPFSAVVIRSPVANAYDPCSVPGSSLGLWPFTRRLLTEARDRAYPLLRRGAAYYHPESRFRTGQQPGPSSPHAGA